MKKSGANKEISGPLKEVFRKELGNTRSEPSQQLWERLELTLDKQQVERDKKKVLFYFRIAAAILLVLATTGLWMLYEQATSNTTNLAVSTKNEGTAADNEVIASQNNQSKPASEPSGSLATNEARNQANENYKGQSRSSGVVANADKKSDDQQPTAKHRNNTSQASDYYNPAKPGNSEAKRSGSKKRNSGINNSGFSESPVSAPFSPLASGTFAAGTKPADGKNEIGKIRQDPAEPFLAGQKVHNKGLPISKEIDEEPENKVNDLALTTAIDSVQADSVKKEFALRPELLPLPVAELTEESVKENRNWSVGLAMASSRFTDNVSLAYQPASDITNAGIQSQLNNAIQEVNTSREPGNSYQTGVAVNKELSKLISLNAGISFARLSTNSSSSYLIKQYSQIGSGQVIQHSVNYLSVQDAVVLPPEESYNLQVESSETYSVQTIFKYLNLPVAVQLQLPVRKWRLFVSPGVQVGRLVGASMQAENATVPGSSYSRSNVTDYREWLLSGMISAGAGYQITDRWQVRGSADLQRGFTGITAQSAETLRSTKPEIFSGSVSFWYTFPTK